MTHLPKKNFAMFTFKFLRHIYIRESRELIIYACIRVISRVMSEVLWLRKNVIVRFWKLFSTTTGFFLQRLFNSCAEIMAIKERGLIFPNKRNECCYNLQWGYVYICAHSITNPSISTIEHFKHSLNTMTCIRL